jgi:hypothetical protein
MNAPQKVPLNRAEEALGLIKAAMDVLGHDAFAIAPSPMRTANASTDYDRARTVAEDIYRIRSTRADILDPELFGEPAWDILVDLFIQESKGKRVSVTSSCIASRVPPTTALRWLSILIERGYVRRIDDDADRRRAFVELTTSGREKLHRLFDRVDGQRFRA